MKLNIFKTKEFRMSSNVLGIKEVVEGNFDRALQR